MFERKILIFLMVVEEGSFSAAAKKLFMSQSAVSQQITRLEDELGVQLFDRTAYRPKITEAGLFYYQEVKRLKNDYTRILHYMRHRTQKHITIGYTTFYVNRFASDFIRTYQSKLAERIEFKYYDLGHYKEVLNKHEVDLVFGLAEEFVNDDSVYSQKICQGHLCAIINQNHPLSANENIDIQLIKNEPMIVLGPDACSHYYRYFLNGLKKDGIVPNIVKRVDTIIDLKMSIALNEGIGLLPREVCTEIEGIKVIPLSHSQQKVYFGIAYQDRVFEYIANAIVEFFQHHKLDL